MRKLFISFVTAVLLASCSADSLMKETELDLTDTEKVYSDITLTRKVAYAHGERPPWQFWFFGKHWWFALYA